MAEAAITGSMLYDLVNCPRRVALELFGDQKKAVHWTSPPVRRFKSDPFRFFRGDSFRPTQIRYSGAI
jgi:hypothetical protein